MYVKEYIDKSIAYEIYFMGYIWCAIGSLCNQKFVLHSTSLYSCAIPVYKMEPKSSYDRLIIKRVN